MDRDKGLGEKSKADQADLDGTFLLLATIIAEAIPPGEQRMKLMSRVTDLMNARKGTPSGRDKAFIKRGEHFIKILNP